VPLLVSLYTDATPRDIGAMVRIFQAHGGSDAVAPQDRVS